MNHILYLGYYSTQNHYRICSPAAVTMMDYLNHAINEAGFNTIILSPAQAGSEYKPREEESIGTTSKAIFLPSYKSVSKKNLFYRILYKIYRERDLYNELRKLVKPNSIILVYHSLALINVLKKLRKHINFTMLMQVCEIYSDVTGEHKKRKRELKWLKSADAYIFSTELLEKEINNDNKPHVILHGTYISEIDRGCKFNDGRIHCVYAGTLDPRKGGAVAAAAAAEFLDEKYHIHILGFGSAPQKESLLKIIDEVSKRTKCKVTFDGLKSGEEYIRFIQSCDIGLSTQDPASSFNNSSFPSKILSYMSNGLRVLSIRIPAVETSAIGKYMFYYNNQTPEKIAKAIKRIDLFDSHDRREIIENLNTLFKSDIKILLDNLTRYNNGK